MRRKKERKRERDFMKEGEREKKQMEFGSE
jgi:hypothetical protein